jgi:hypothetical protein
MDEEDPIRVLLITGSGESFIVGNDMIPTAVDTDTWAGPAPSCRRRPVSTTMRLAQRKVVDTGLRRHDEVGVVRESLFRAVGMTGKGTAKDWGCVGRN